MVAAASAWGDGAAVAIVAKPIGACFAEFGEFPCDEASAIPARAYACGGAAFEVGGEVFGDMASPSHFEGASGAAGGGIDGHEADIAEGGQDEAVGVGDDFLAIGFEEAEGFAGGGPDDAVAGFAGGVAAWRESFDGCFDADDGIGALVVVFGADAAFDGEGVVEGGPASPFGSGVDIPELVGALPSVGGVGGERVVGGVGDGSEGVFGEEVLEGAWGGGEAQGEELGVGVVRADGGGECGPPREGGVVGEELGFVEVEPAPGATGDGIVEAWIEEGVCAGVVGIEDGVIGSGGDAFVGDGLDHGGVFGPCVGVGFFEGGGVLSEGASVALADDGGAFADEFGEGGVGGDAIEFGGLLSGGECGHGPGIAEASLGIGDEVDGGVVGSDEGEDMEEVEFADEVEGGGLPASGGEGGGIAGILAAIFDGDEAVQVGAPEDHKEEDGEGHHDEDEGLASSGGVGEWGWISGGRGRHGRGSRIRRRG